MMWLIDSIHFINSIEQQKAMLREVQAALVTAQAAQGMPQPATATLIPKPRGTSSHGKFNLANEMGVDKKLCGQIQVCLSFSPLLLGFICPGLYTRHPNSRESISTTGDICR